MLSVSANVWHLLDTTDDYIQLSSAYYRWFYQIKFYIDS